MTAKSDPVCSEILTINPTDPEGFVLFVRRLSELLQDLDHLFPPLIILCIGSDRSTGDALGPLVGSMLTGMKMQDVVVYGTLETPVHALNLEQTFTALRVRHGERVILAVDSSLGAKKNVGCLQLGMGSIRPGAGVHKKLPAVGDFFITGIVNVGGFMEFLVLQSTRLGVVLPLARFISSGIMQALFRSGFRQ
ncbi:MAG: spore protease YyaC [Bacillota bacterium]